MWVAQWQESDIDESAPRRGSSKMLEQSFIIVFNETEAVVVDDMILLWSISLTLC